MLTHTILLVSLIRFGAYALPGGVTQTSDNADNVARACAPLARPTAPYTVVASRPNSPIHYLAMNAGPNHRIILGGEADVPPCPFKDQSKCPPGAYTVFTGSGSLVSAQPHSVFAYRAYLVPVCCRPRWPAGFRGS